MDLLWGFVGSVVEVPQPVELQSLEQEVQLFAFLRIWIEHLHGFGQFEVYFALSSSMVALLEVLIRVFRVHHAHVSLIMLRILQFESASSMIFLWNKTAWMPLLVYSQYIGIDDFLILSDLSCSLKIIVGMLNFLFENDDTLAYPLFISDIGEPQTMLKAFFLFLCQPEQFLELNGPCDRWPLDINQLVSTPLLIKQSFFVANYSSYFLSLGLQNLSMSFYRLIPEDLEVYKFVSILHVSCLFLLPPSAIMIVLIKGFSAATCCIPLYLDQGGEHCRFVICSVGKLFEVKRCYPPKGSAESR